LAPLHAGDTYGLADVYVRECPLPTTYCTAKVNSRGCLPAILPSGVPAASAPSGFTVDGQSVLNNTAGMLVYSTAGAAAIPFAGGTLCLQAPRRRTPAQPSGGATTGVDCSGRFSIDFNAWIATGVNPSLLAGVNVWAQYWSRDPGFSAPNNVSLTDAVSFTIGP
jgi:hypothetical protein